MEMSNQAVESTVDVKSAAVMLGVSVVTLRRMIAAGEISFRRVGSGSGRIRFTAGDLREYLDRKRHPPVTRPAWPNKVSGGPREGRNG